MRCTFADIWRTMNKFPLGEKIFKWERRKRERESHACVSHRVIYWVHLRCTPLQCFTFIIIDTVSCCCFIGTSLAQHSQCVFNALLYYISTLTHTHSLKCKAPKWKSVCSIKLNTPACVYARALNAFWYALCFIVWGCKSRGWFLIGSWAHSLSAAQLSAPCQQGEIVMRH